MSKKIVYLLGAGASANAIPVMKKLPKSIKYFYRLVTELLRSNGKLTDSYDILNPLYEEILEEIEKFGTPDIVAKISMHKGEEEEVWRLKDLLTCYMLFEQLDSSETGFLDWGGSVDAKVRSEIFNDKDVIDDILIKNRLDNRYVEFLSATLKGVRDRIHISENMSIVSWNYDHQIEKALSVFAKDRLRSLQEKFKIFPFTNSVDYRVKPEQLKILASEARVIKINGTAGFSKSELISSQTLFDINNHNWDQNSLENMGKLIFRERVFNNEDNKLSFAWETDSENVPFARQSAADKVRDAEAVVVIGYSFPNFNREVDRQIFENFDVDNSKIYIQDPNPDEIIEKLDGVKKGLKDKAVAVRSGGSFTIPNEFWE